MGFISKNANEFHSGISDSTICEGSPSSALIIALILNIRPLNMSYLRIDSKRHTIAIKHLK
jgi:hypothetical protein